MTDDLPPSPSPIWPDHYRLLGVTPAAGPDDIERACALALDRLPRGAWGRAVAWLCGRGAGDLHCARDTLLDPVRRRQYDEDLRAAQRFPPFLFLSP